MISIQVNDRNGPVVGACIVEDEDEVMLISSGGVLIRTRVKEISVVGRNTQGVNVMEMSAEEHLVGMEKVAESEGE